MEQVWREDVGYIQGGNKMNERVAKILRPVRTGLQMVVEPIDWVGRQLNGKRGYPPLWVRQKVGNLFDFEGSGAEYMAYLKLLCGLEPGDNVLDIGCGCGLMCLKFNENGTLLEYIRPGSYCGMDIDGKLIRWCEKNIQRPRCMFLHLEERDKNRLPGLKETVDVVIAKSLLTHLLPSEVESYLKDINRLLKQGGRCLSTWFLLNKEECKGRYKFSSWDGKCHFFTERKDKPKLAVGYDEKWLLEKCKKLGFGVQVWYGSWRGNGGGLSFQDIIILRKG